MSALLLDYFGNPTTHDTAEDFGYLDFGIIDTDPPEQERRNDGPGFADELSAAAYDHATRDDDGPAPLRFHPE